MDSDKLIRLVEDWVSLRAVQQKLNDILSKTLSSETFLALAKTHKQLWGIHFHLNTVPMEAVQKVLTDKGKALEVIYQTSLKSGNRISRTKTSSPKAKAKTAKSKGLSFMS